MKNLLEALLIITYYPRFCGVSCGCRTWGVIGNTCLDAVKALVRKDRQVDKIAVLDKVSGINTDISCPAKTFK
jgi:hypothetical protein